MEMQVPQIKLRAKDQVIFDKLTEAYEKTEIIQRQRELTAGRWDFVVFGVLVFLVFWSFGVLGF